MATITPTVVSRPQPARAIMNSDRIIEPPEIRNTPQIAAAMIPAV